MESMFICICVCSSLLVLLQCADAVFVSPGRPHVICDDVPIAAFDVVEAPPASVRWTTSRWPQLQRKSQCGMDSASCARPLPDSAGSTHPLRHQRRKASDVASCCARLSNRNLPRITVGISVSPEYVSRLLSTARLELPCHGLPGMPGHHATPSLRRPRGRDSPPF